MKTTRSFTVSVVSAVVLLVLSGCAGMTAREQNTAVGAGIGAVGGAVLTGGSPIGVVGGAAVGGVIGHSLDTDRRRY